MEGNFKNTYNFSKRLKESKKILDRYPTRIPIIVEKHSQCELPTIDKCKYLVPKDMKIGQFIFEIRNRIKMKSSHALFITINNKLVSSSSLVSGVYDEESEESPKHDKHHITRVR